MNELIRKFAKQANSYTDSQVQISGDNHRDWMISRDEKFAELIVSEFKSILLNMINEGQGDFDTLDQALTEINEHFGVK